MNLQPGAVLSNQELTDSFKVGNMGGMRRSLSLNCLILVSDPFKALYEDQWHGEILYYTGMGQKGDQSFSAQNKTLRDAKQLGITVYLFEALEPKRYTFIGEVELCGEIRRTTQPDISGKLRSVLLFPLKVCGPSDLRFTYELLENKRIALARAAKKRSEADLLKRVMFVHDTPGTRTTISTQYDRNQDVVEYVLRAAGGRCQLCNEQAPFARPSGEPYLEVHHVIWLARGGLDSVSNTVALCPNCHRKMHILDNRMDIEALLKHADNAAKTLNGHNHQD